MTTTEINSERRTDRQLSDMIHSLQNHGEAGFVYVRGEDYLSALTELRDRRAAGGVAVAVLRLIDDLRRDEGDQVTILCDNPDFNGQPNNAVVISAGWTNWQDFRVSGHTLHQALQNAVAIRAMAPADRPTLHPSNSGVAVKALEAAKEMAKTMEGLCAGRSDDEWIWSVQEQIDAALSALHPSPDTGKSQACVSETAQSDTQAGLPIVDDTQGEVFITDEMVDRLVSGFRDEKYWLFISRPAARAALTAALKGGPDGK